MWVVAILVTVGGSVLGCGAPPPPDAADAGTDSSAPEDSASPLPDAAVDSVVSDAAPPPDSMVADTSPPDASTCPTPCAPTSECLSAICRDATCVETPAPDGTPCGEITLDICVAGACVARGCGDGYREPASSPMREGCDDGNAADGDACSSACSPTAVVLAVDPVGEYNQWPALQGTAVAADGRGELLFVWADSHFGSDGLDVVARRYTRGGVAVPAATDPLRLDVGNFQSPEPQVAGLRAGGWVVVWNDDRTGTSREISYRMVAPDGSVGPLRTANQTLGGPQYQAHVTTLDEGFVIAWTNILSITDDPDMGILARRFSEAGTPLGDEMFVAIDRRNRQSEPRLAADGNAWLILFTHSVLAPGARPTLYGRRYEGAVAVDAVPFVLSSMMEGARSAVASLGAGAYAATWAQRGDIYARVIPIGDPTPDPTMLLTVEATAAFETYPSVAPLGGTDFVVCYEAGIDGYDFATSPGATLAMEAMGVRTLVTNGDVGRASVTATPDGLWFVWAGGIPTPGADALSTHFLAID